MEHFVDGVVGADNPDELDNSLGKVEILPRPDTNISQSYVVETLLNLCLAAESIVM